MNYAGYESGVSLMAEGRDIPLLQDTVAADVLGSWQPTYRDVVVLDANNEVVGVYNLTSHDLGQPANYEALKTLLIEAAQ